MLDELRKPFFVLAVVLIVLAVLLELGSPLLLQVNRAVPDEAWGTKADGLGVPAIALLDALLILTVGLMAMSLLLPERVHGRVQGIVTLVVAIVVLLGALAMLFAAIGSLMLMLGLLLAPIFGTIAYFVVYADFARGDAAIVLSLVMLLKLGFAGCLVFAHQRFLENKGLVLMLATSLLAVLVLSFLHGLVPGFLASITDAIGAIVIAVLTLLWAIFFVIGGVMAVLKAVA